MSRTRVPARMRYEVMRRDRNRCRQCNRAADQLDDTERLEVDHLIPEALGGPTEPSNLQTLCSTCNAGKSSAAADHHQIAELTDRQATARQALADVIAADRRTADQLDTHIDQFDTAWSRWTIGGRPIPRPATWRADIRRFLTNPAIVPADLTDAIDVATAAEHIAADQTWRYFCGVLHNWTRDRIARASDQTTDSPTPPAGDAGDNDDGSDYLRQLLDSNHANAKPSHAQMLRLAGTALGHGRTLDVDELADVLLARTRPQGDPATLKHTVATVLTHPAWGTANWLPFGPAADPTAFETADAIHEQLTEPCDAPEIIYTADTHLLFARILGIPPPENVPDDATEIELEDRAIAEIARVIRPARALFDTADALELQWDPTASAGDDTWLHEPTAETLGIPQDTRDDVVVLATCHAVGLPAPSTPAGRTFVRNAVAHTESRLGCSEVHAARHISPVHSWAATWDLGRALPTRRADTETPATLADSLAAGTETLRRHVVETLSARILATGGHQPLCSGGCPKALDVPF